MKIRPSLMEKLHLFPMSSTISRDARQGGGAHGDPSSSVAHADQSWVILPICE
jgi:hypothetical protein